jgi:predicted permease
VNVIVNGDAQLGTSYQASGNYFTVLGVQAALGRVFGEGDDRLSAAPVAVISHPYWVKRFAGAPSAINRVVSINGQMVTIVGVTPADFTGIERLGADAPDVTVPLAFDAVFRPPTPVPDEKTPIPRMQQPTDWWLQLVGRLRPGASLEQAQANFATVFQRTAQAGMAGYQSSLTAEEKALSYNRQRGDAVPELLIRSAAHGYYDIDPQAQRSAGFLVVVVAIVLLIVCANVANLLLSRATSRHREISVRLSMGATRGRLVRQLLTESLLLSSLGGVLGVLIGYWSRALLPFGEKAPLDWRVFGFVAGVSLLTGIIFGLLPALRATGVDLAGAMKESSRSVTGSRTLLSKALVVVQVAMSVVLLVGAGLFLRTLENLKSVDVGFDSKNLLMFNVNPGVNRYDPERSAQVFHRVLERMASLPGVTAAALTRTTLLSGNTSTSSMWTQGQTSQTAAEENMYMMDVSPAFFATLGIRLHLQKLFEGGASLRAIGGPWFAEQHETVTNAKAFAENLQGKLLVEISEMDAFSRAEVTKVKQVITSPSDRFREPYGRHSKDHPRQCIFAGSTNKDDWNRDETGARRFWPVACLNDIDVAAIQASAQSIRRPRAKVRDGWEPIMPAFGPDKASEEDLIKVIAAGAKGR